MKTRLTLIVGQYNKFLSYSDDNYFKVLLDGSQDLPKRYLSTKNEKETLKELWEEYLEIYFDWANINLIDFRKYMINECEAIYCCKLFHIFGATKKGKFVSHNSNIRLDPYHEELLAKRVRPGFTN
jgi:hypothetical protein